MSQSNPFTSGRFQSQRSQFHVRGCIPTLARHSPLRSGAPCETESFRFLWRLLLLWVAVTGVDNGNSGVRTVVATTIPAGTRSTLAGSVASTMGSRHSYPPTRPSLTPAAFGLMTDAIPCPVKTESKSPPCDLVSSLASGENRQPVRIEQDAANQDQRARLHDAGWAEPRVCVEELLEPGASRRAAAGDDPRVARQARWRGPVLRRERIVTSLDDGERVVE